MNKSAEAPAPATDPSTRRLPILPLVLLAAVGFLLITLETLPAGLLPEMASGLHTSEGTVGLFVSAYAIGTVVVTVPAISLTRAFRRKPLLLGAIALMVVANTVVALSPDLTASLAARFVGGAMAGTIWGLFATYARSISPPRSAGLALAVVSIGPPIGLALGTPLGSLLGTTFDWRWSFGGLSVVGAVIFVLVVGFVPDVPGQDAAVRLPIGRVFRIRGISMIVAVIVTWMLAHNTIYTYISPYLLATGTGITASLMLLVYGVAAIVGVLVTGVLLDRHPRPLLHASTFLFVGAAVILLVGHSSTTAVLIAAALWGVTFGGASTQLQAFLITAAGDNADVASAFIPVAYNIAIFAAGVLGAALLTSFSGLALTVVMIVFGIVASLLALVGRRTAFPASL